MTTHKVIYFWEPDHKKYGAYEVLSPLYPAVFTDPEDGTEYQHVKQYVVKKKADMLQNKKVAQKIMNTTSVFVMEHLGRIQGTKLNMAQWEAKRKQITKNGYRLQFKQHPSMYNILKNTGSRKLVAAAPEDIGGDNELGTILMELRQEFYREEYYNNSLK